jgi:hypothetical protein
MSGVFGVVIDRCLDGNSWKLITKTKNFLFMEFQALAAEKLLDYNPFERKKDNPFVLKKIHSQINLNLVQFCLI